MNVYTAWTVRMILDLIRALTVTAVLLLVFRSLADRFVPKHRRNRLSVLYRLTEKAVDPVRSVLPAVLLRPSLDFAPLVSGILLILIGLGLETLLGGIFR